MLKIFAIPFLLIFSIIFIFLTSHYVVADNTASSGYEYHHIYPQQFRAEFEKIGINIDDYTIKILKKYHIKHKAINKEWEEFFEEHKNPTKKEAEKFAIKMLKKYNFKDEKDIGVVDFYNYITKKETGESIDLSPSFFERTLDFFGAGIDKILNLFGGVVNFVIFIATIFWEKIGSFFTLIWGAISDFFARFWGAISDFFGWILEVLGDFFGWILEVLGDIITWLFINVFSSEE